MLDVLMLNVSVTLKDCYISQTIVVECIRNVSSFLKTEVFFIKKKLILCVLIIKDTILHLIPCFMF